MKIDRLGGAYGISDLEIRYNIEWILIQWQEKSKILLHRQTGIQQRCTDSYMIVATSIGSMVEHNHIIILTLKADGIWSIGYKLLIWIWCQITSFISWCMQIYLFKQIRYIRLNCWRRQPMELFYQPSCPKDYCHRFIFYHNSLKLETLDEHQIYSVS